MDFSELTVKILFLFFPGIIIYIIVNALTEHKEKKVMHFIMESFVYGVISYSFLSMIYCLINYIVKLCKNSSELKISFFDNIINSNSKIELGEIFWVTVLSLVLGFIISACINKSLLHRIAKLLNVGSKIGAIDVWYSVLNSSNVEWVVVRDKENDLMYEGKVVKFSSESENNELFLRNVIVYVDSTAQKLYETDAVYLTLKKDNIIIEVTQLIDDTKTEIIKK